MNAFFPLHRNLLLGLWGTQLYRFVEKCFEELHPGLDRPFIPNWHIEAICFELTRVANGENRRLLVTMPPRHLKSICVSVAFVAWKLGHDPSFRFIVASYSDKLAADLSNSTRQIMMSDWYRELFPNTVLAASKQLELRTTEKGHRIAVTVTGAVTGFGADMIIIDDPMKASDASSDIERQRVIDYYTQSLLSRLNDQRKDAVVIVQQRLHEDDLAGFALRNGGYRHLNLPAIADEDERIQTSATEFCSRLKGEALSPRFQSLADLSAMRTEMGPSVFSAQYQQDPTPPGGNRADWGWFGTYVSGPYARHDYLHVVQSWDTGMTGEPTSDFSVGTTWGFRNDHWELIDLERVRLDFPDLKSRVLGLANKYSADQVLIEKAGSGHSLLQQLRPDNRTSTRFIGQTTSMDKVTRFEAITGHLVTGRYRVPEHADWLSGLRRELLAFPKGRYDDQVDSLVQFIEWEQSRRGRGLMNRDPVTRRPHGSQFRPRP